MQDYSYFDLLICIQEIREFLLGKKLVFIRGRGKDYYMEFKDSDLYLHFYYGYPGYRLALTEQFPEESMMILGDKYGAILTDAKVFKDDRVAVLVFTKVKAKWALIFELTGKNSNLILINQSGIISYIARPVGPTQSRVRQLQVGMKYVPPPKPERLKLLPFFEKCPGKKEAYKIKSGYLLLSKDSRIPVGWSPCVYGEEIIFKEYSPYTVAIEAYYTLISSPSGSSRESIRRERLKEEFEKIKEFKKYKDLADLLLSSFPSSYVFESPEVHLNSTVIPVTPGKTVKEEAEKYYKLYKKFKRGYEKLKQLLNEEEVEASIQITRKETPLQRKKREKYLEFISPGGHRVLVGRNATGNDFITFTLAHKEDIFFHVKDYSGPHVVLIKGEGPVSSEDILFAASKAAEYSKAGLGKIEV
ncbi:hypothetical protein DRN58_08035, partial [Thermococci archaeon]